MMDFKTIGIFAILGFGASKLFGSSGNNNSGSGPISAPNPDDSNKPGPAPKPAPVPYTPPANDSFPLKYGSKGEAVKSLQALMIEYATLKNLAILKNDPMKLLSDGKPDGDFGPQTQRWSIATMQTSVVNLTAYNWLLNQVVQLRKGAPVQSATAFNIGDVVYSKGARTFPRYRSNLQIKRGSVWVTPTFEQFIAHLSKGAVFNQLDTVEFASGEIIGRVASVNGDKIRVVASEKTEKHGWWINWVQAYNDYFVVSSSQIFK